ncbi:MAG: hypothetical protein WA280_22005, partial [Xanthobacteraceae bacterium]
MDRSIDSSSRERDISDPLFKQRHSLLVTAGLDSAVDAEMKRPQPTRTFVSRRHCEERSDEAIQGGNSDWIASWSLSSGRALRADPLARNDEINFYAAPGFRFALPGLRRNKRKEADRRQTRYSTTRTQAAHRARRGYGGLRRPFRFGRARLPAFHHG